MNNALYGLLLDYLGIFVTFLVFFICIERSEDTALNKAYRVLVAAGMFVFYLVWAHLKWPDMNYLVNGIVLWGIFMAGYLIHQKIRRRVTCVASRHQGPRQMREPPVVITLLLAVMVTLAIGVIVFPAAAWLYPLEGHSEDDLSRVLRNSAAMFITLVASFVAQKYIRKFFNRKTDNS